MKPTSERFRFCKQTTVLICILFICIIIIINASNVPTGMVFFQNKLAQPVLSVAVRWAAMCPFSSSGSSKQTLQLIGGPSANPNSVFVYQGGTGAPVMAGDANLGSSISLAPNLVAGTISFQLNLAVMVTQLSTYAVISAYLTLFWQHFYC